MCVCVWLKIQLTTASYLCTAGSHTHFSFVYSNNTFISIKNSQHTRNQCDKNTVKRMWIFVNKTHAGARTQIAHMSIYFTPNDETYSCVAGFIRFFTPWNFILVFNARAITELFFIRKEGGRGKYVAFWDLSLILSIR